MSTTTHTIDEETPTLPADLIPATALARRLSVSLRTVRELQAQHKIPFYRITRRAVRFCPVKVAEALAAMEVPAGAQTTDKKPAKIGPAPARN